MVDLLRQQDMTDALNIPRANIAQTTVGMAHFSGTGPVGTFCGGCTYWQSNGARVPKQICQKFKSMTGDSKRPVGAMQHSCRHFEARPK